MSFLFAHLCTPFDKYFVPCCFIIVTIINFNPMIQAIQVYISVNVRKGVQEFL